MTVQEFRRKLAREDLERLCLPEEFWRVKLQGVDSEMAPQVERYLRALPDMIARSAGLLLGGAPGTGKTAIAALIAKEARSRGYTAFFTTVWELRECVKSRVPFDDNTSVLDRCRDVDVLILDGLREEDAKEYQMGLRAIEELLTSRGSRRKVTVVTTRMSVADLRDKMSSLLDAVQGCMLYVPVTGDNRRRDQNQELRRAVFG